MVVAVYELGSFCFAVVGGCEVDLDKTNDQKGVRRADIYSGFPA